MCSIGAGLEWEAQVSGSSWDVERLEEAGRARAHMAVRERRVLEPSQRGAGGWGGGACRPSGGNCSGGGAGPT